MIQPGAPGAVGAAGSDEVVRPHVVALLRAVMPTPALVLGRDRHLLAWNAMAHALDAPHLDRAAVEDPDSRPWWPDLLFCDACVADLFTDWATKAQDTVADLRIEFSRRPDDDHLVRLVEGLRARSREFERLWSSSPSRLAATTTAATGIPTSASSTCTTSSSSWATTRDSDSRCSRHPWKRIRRRARAARHAHGGG